MCKSFEIAKKTIDDYLNKGKPFTYNELCDNIINKGGVLRVYSMMTVREYLKELIDDKIIFYNVYNETYDFPIKNNLNSFSKDELSLMY